MEQKEIWIVSAKRTPMGKFQGLLADYSSPQLGALAIQGALEQAQLSPYEVDEVYMGCVLPAGCGQAPARQAALGGGLEQSTPCTTVNKVCGSGMKSVMLAHDLIKLGSIQCAVAGGMESMTNAPYLMKESRSGMRIGHKTTYDHMFLDGLQDAYEGELMGVYGQQIADQLAFTREQMDEWATQSVYRALAADKQNMFGDELVSISLKNGETLNYDEQPRSIDANKIPKLKPAFAKEGSITAANSSAISDGAAALILMESEKASRLEKKPLAIIKAHSTHARKPSEFTVAPVYAIEQLLSTLDWETEDVDLWEINEAFAVVTQIAVKELQLDSSKVNIKGGACALGHPIGASGARILTTLIYSLRQLQAYGVDGDATKRKPMKGVAAICIGGGEATAIAIEIPV
ncbi:acetyl-CoA C-acyltransferase [Vibrio tubiashii]|uniref:acetyl-CoA C-acyltransferase n=1 Tax=Vibrio tubiashii TaxID=29498 RepID=UPI001EFCBDC2|nr:acetyl-CoA C-acyltransferase [Vibrio tubiashii]MCG9580968.1 acetyl-CoA C-acyltransferase [Vibrio tubiashii]MCG9614559.1 acetyl-CoA C-acyltransferase [Vibrio tubiashii]MCG9687809.1 acetyl-CoA C-acyltransferase [Vibrio tubiashii]